MKRLLIKLKYWWVANTAHAPDQVVVRVGMMESSVEELNYLGDKYNGIIPTFVLRKMFNQKNFEEKLELLDPMLYKRYKVEMLEAIL